MKKVLIVDDDRVTLTMFEQILSNSGYEVISAKDGEEGYERALEVKPDLLISDMLIPKVDGLQLCKRIKENPALSHTKVILMTGVYKGMIFRFDAKEVGADDFVEKPFEKDDLIKRIESLIGSGDRKSAKDQKTENSSD